jgi:hypothetical protein
MSGLSLAADIVGAALPIATGLGVGLRTLFKAGEAVEKASDVVRVLDKADDVTDVVLHTDDLVDTTRLTSGLPDETLVCRGGLCDAASFKPVDNDGRLFDISVQSAPGKTVDELSVRLPNNQIGVTTVGNVRAAGGDVFPTPKTGDPFHADLSGITPSQAQDLFQPTRPNPVPRESRVRPW